jgi:hypothetical protein
MNQRMIKKIGLSFGCSMLFLVLLGGGHNAIAQLTLPPTRVVRPLPGLTAEKPSAITVKFVNVNWIKKTPCATPPAISSDHCAKVDFTISDVKPACTGAIYKLTIAPSKSGFSDCARTVQEKARNSTYSLLAPYDTRTKCSGSGANDVSIFVYCTGYSPDTIFGFAVATVEPNLQ